MSLNNVKCGRKGISHVTVFSCYYLFHGTASIVVVTVTCVELNDMTLNTEESCVLTFPMKFCQKKVQYNRKVGWIHTMYK